MRGDGVSESNFTENPSRPGRVGERNLTVESEYEYGSRMGFWRMFKLFNAFKMKFTLYAVGQAVEENPNAVRRCVEMGHDVASHCYRWIDYHPLSEEEEKTYIRTGLKALKALSGYAPKGFVAL
jgi:peptidoglycan/xylan/chitin deacetylase (PgdA/CDA1 family)